MSLPPRVVLHVGMAKTGSTAVQNFMAAQHDALRARGVLFPRSVLRRSNPADPSRTPGHLDLLRQLVAGEETPLLAECAAAGSGIHTLFLSIENLFNMEPDASVAALADFLAGREIRLIAVLRDPQDWTASRYYEAVTTGQANKFRTIDRYVEELLEAGTLDYPARLDRLRDAFAPARFAVHDHREIAAKENAVAVFLAELGVTLDAPEVAATPRVNVSRAYPESIEAHRRLNSFVRKLPLPQRFAFAETMKTHYAALAAAGALKPGGAAISPPLRRALHDATAAGCRALSERHFGGRPFGPDAAWVAAAPPPLDEALVAAIQDFGFGAFLAQLRDAAATPEPARTGKPAPRFELAAEEARHLRAVYAAARVILEYGAGDATLIAAGMAGKFVMSVESDRDRALAMQLHLATAALPSAAVIHHVDVGPARADPAGAEEDPATSDARRRYARAIWDETFFRHPDAILIAGRFRPACLAAVQARIARPVTLLYADYAERAARARDGDPGAAVRPVRMIGRMAEFRLAPQDAARTPADDPRPGFAPRPGPGPGRHA